MEKGGWGIGAVFLILTLLAGAILPAHAQPDTRTAWRFGVTGTAYSPADLRDLGVGWQRVTFEWATFQPTGPDDFDTDAVDPALLESAQSGGREIVGLITGTPAWVSDSGELHAVPTGLDLPPGDPANVWAAFMRRLVTFYGPLGVRRWIIYDEPDVGIGEGRVSFAGNVDEYAQLVRAADRAAASVDPTVLIHLGALNWWVDAAAGREPYLARLLDALRVDSGGPGFDVVTLRVRTGTQATWDMIAAARAILAAANRGSTPVWLEANINPDPGALLGVTPQQQADYIVQAAAITLAAGVERLAILDPPGLIGPDGTRLPAFDAYRNMIGLVGAARSATHYPHPAADLVEIDTGGGWVYILWARDALAVQGVITSPGVDEAGRQYAPGTGFAAVRSLPEEWPASFTVDAPAATRDANGYLTVAGSPRALALDDPGDFYRVVYLIINGAYVRLR
ncbi:MAG: hypothetical protein JXQ72_09230 [Anaerolineae bacterium]|nr:hypothetical protein [Anaerolineae bacterium]